MHLHLVAPLWLCVHLGQVPWCLQNIVTCIVAACLVVTWQGGSGLLLFKAGGHLEVVVNQLGLCHSVPW